MDDRYINYYANSLTAFEQRALLRRWWRLFREEARATPFHFPHLRKLLNAPSFKETVVLRLYIEALPKQSSLQGSSFEVPVATALVRSFSERPDVAYLSLFRSANDAASLHYLLDALRDELPGPALRMYMPLAPLPHLAAGLLSDSWQRANPMHSLFHPPYLLELCQINLKSAATLAVLTLASDTRLEQPRQTELRLVEAQNEDWQLLSSAFDRPWLGPPSSQEIALLQDYLAFSDLYAVVAKKDDQVLGLLIMQGEEGQRLRRSRGARTLLGKIQYAVPSRPTEGRILYLVVKPQAREEGVGQFLLASALAKAREEGWKRLLSSPLDVASSGAKWLLKRQAQVQQHYQLFYVDI